MKKHIFILNLFLIWTLSASSQDSIIYKTDTTTFIENHNVDNVIDLPKEIIKGEWKSTSNDNRLNIGDSILIWTKDSQNTIRYIYQINDVVEHGTNNTNLLMTLFKEGSKTVGEKKDDELLIYSIKNISDSTLTIEDFLDKISFEDNKSTIRLTFEKE